MHRGDALLTPAATRSLIDRYLSRPERGHEPSPERLAALTDREREVLAAMAAGLSNAAIARTLYMSERAVEKHITSVFQKLRLSDEGDLNRRVSAVLAYLQAKGD